MDEDIIDEVEIVDFDMPEVVEYLHEHGFYEESYWE